VFEIKIGFLLLEKHFRINARLPENGAQRTFRHIAQMIGERGIAMRLRVEPDFMRTRSLTGRIRNPIASNA
jgi:hypothetical protein